MVTSIMSPRHDTSRRCTSAGKVTACLLLSFLAVSPLAAAHSRESDGLRAPPNLAPLLPIIPIISTPNNDAYFQQAQEFKLRHLFHHGAYLYPKLHRRRDVIDSDAQLFMTSEDGKAEPLPPLLIRSQSTKVQRLKDRRPSVVDPMVAAAREHGQYWTSSASAWTLDEVPGPNLTDKITMLSLAEMAASAYVQETGMAQWENIADGFNSSTDFGWESDGLRGHVWANDDNSTVIISLKGTTVAVFDGSGTTTPDKENDNLFFSCCCGQQSQMNTRQVCDCASGTYSCNTTCVGEALRKENRYYQAARELYSNVTALFPDSSVWVTGHSLGGSVSSLLGMTYGLPSITFEAPPENLAAKRLGLPMPPGVDPGSPNARKYTGSYHVGHTADPIFLGICNGVTSPCSWGGYAMETACHTSVECVYDVVADKGWRVATTSHSIRSVIDNIIKKYNDTPECVTTPECIDCPLWKFYESNSSEPIKSTTSSSTKTRTRTETCKTPGWWGCLDETTTASTATTTDFTTTSSTTVTTSTCKTPGWFGCKDKPPATSSLSTIVPTATGTDPTPTRTAPTASTAPTTLTPSPTCQTPGFWGCKDKTSETSPTPPITSAPPMPSNTATTTAMEHKCTSKQWFGLVCVDPSPTNVSKLPKATDGAPHKPVCLHRSWLGYCKEWGEALLMANEEL